MIPWCRRSALSHACIWRTALRVSNGVVPVGLKSDGVQLHARTPAKAVRWVACTPSADPLDAKGACPGDSQG
jgi:hypothetical protein